MCPQASLDAESSTSCPMANMRFDWPMPIFKVQRLVLASLILWSSAKAVDFNRDIRPILSNKCFACHGFDEHDRKADLRLDTREGAFADLGGYAAIVPGNLDDSEAWYRIITDDEDELMPPPKCHKPLTKDEKNLIKKWIESGAEYKTHWSYAPLEKETDLPGDESLIDFYIKKQLKPKGLTLSPAADKISLVRRLYFDLLGLPAPVESINEYINDKSADAYEKLVDRLLADSAFGERLAVYWLDLVRYADTIGYHSDNKMEVSAYRDYVISAFNRNLPYDQFTIEQLAGDLIPEATQEQRIASGYNRLLQSTEEGGAQAAEYMTIYAADRVRNASIVWLGSTIGCAQCHDHKFDPFTAKDFYSFAAFFADVKEKPIGKRQPNMRLPTPQDTAEIERLKLLVAGSKLETVLAKDSDLKSKVDLAFAGWQENFEKKSDAQQTDEWSVVKPAKWKSTEGLKFTLLEDQSLLVGKLRPKSPTYNIELVAPGTATAIRLEALTHASLPKGRLSSGNGNFVLTNFQVLLNNQPVEIASALASYEQPGYPIAATIDADKKSGWAVSGHTDKAASQAAVFVFKQPLTLSETDRLTIELKHESDHAVHNIGRLRFSLTAETNPTLGEMAADIPAPIAAILKVEKPKRSDKQNKQLREHFYQQSPLLADARKVQTTNTKKLQDYEKSIRTMLVSEALPKPRMTRLLHRGDWMDKTGEITPPALPAFLPKDADLPADRRGTRLDLAQWIVADSNPLTARTFVNRIWMLLFGEGISRDVDDLGGQGQPPTHPELLDQLAIQFRENGWDVKALVKSILMSDAYQQSSVPSAELTKADPTNQLISRQGRWRIEAEFVRDTALSLSGLLADETGGVSVKPYQPAGYWQHLNFPKRKWDQGNGAQLYRRGVYTYWCRSFLHPAMIAFDAPSREECTAKRSRSNIPQQALTLMNDPSFVEAARKFGERLVSMPGTTNDRLLKGWQLATGRTATADELAVLESILDSQLKEYTLNPEAAKLFINIGESASASSLDPIKLAAWTQVARVILNAYETTSRY